MLGIMFVWPKNFHDLGKSKTSLRRLDYFGGLLMLSGSVLLVFMLFQGAARVYPWTSPQVIITLTLAASCWVGLIVWEFHLSKRQTMTNTIPHLPFRLMKNRVMLSGFMCVSLPSPPLYGLANEE